MLCMPGWFLHEKVRHLCCLKSNFLFLMFVFFVYYTSAPMPEAACKMSLTQIFSFNTCLADPLILVREAQNARLVLPGCTPIQGSQNVKCVTLVRTVLMKKLKNARPVQVVTIKLVKMRLLAMVVLVDSMD